MNKPTWIKLDVYRSLLRTFGEARKEITALKKAKAHLEELVLIDELTGLYNRRGATKKFAEESSRVKRENGNLIGLLMIDIDFFKSVNDVYGHHVGDAALRSVAQTMSHAAREYDTLARWGGEEFVMILPCHKTEEAEKIAERVRSTIEEKDFRFEGCSIPLTVSIGVYVVPHDVSNSLEESQVWADKALYAAKEEGCRNSVYLLTNGDETPCLCSRGAPRSRPADGVKGQEKKLQQG